jgi:multicomponent Na+:H+ antiporter subunit E
MSELERRRLTPKRWHLPSLFMPASLLHVAVLVVLWLLLWDRFTIGNLLTGVVVAVVLVIAFPIPRQRRKWYTVRPLATVRFGAHVLRNVVESNVWLAREVVSRRTRIRTAIVATPLDGCSPELLTFVANLIALTPGTMVVEASASPPILYVHVLDLRSIEEVRADVHRLESLAVHAFGSEDAIAAVDRGRADRRRRRGQGVDTP